jgi:hypothetical protein
MELNNSDSGDSPSTISADKSNIKIKVCNTKFAFEKNNIFNKYVKLGYGTTL